MTRSRYLIALALQKFGVLRKAKRLNDLAFERHLMADGEELLGAYCWQNTEEIEDLSLEYWRLKDLDREKNKIMASNRQAEAKMAEAQNAKASLVSVIQERQKPSAQRRAQFVEELKNVQYEYDAQVKQALATKKRHQALKVKLKYLQEGSAPQKEIDECLASLADFRKMFISEKSQIDALKNQIDSCQKNLWELEEKIGEQLRGSEGETNLAYASISEANRDITNYKAQLGTIAEEQQKLFRDVGHFLNLNHRRGDCLKACKGHRVLLTQVRLLRTSIDLNRQLAESISTARTKNKSVTE